MRGWLDIFCTYALLKAQSDDKKASYEALRIADSAAPFVSWDSYYYHIHIVWLLCAIQLQDVEHARMEVRFLAKMMPYESNVYRLWNAVQNLCASKSQRFYSAKTHIQFFRRYVRIMDFALADAKDRASSSFSPDERAGAMDPRKLTTSKAANKSEGNPYGVVQANVELLLLFGNLLASNSLYPEALTQYLRAYSEESKQHRRSSSLTPFLISTTYMRWAIYKTCDDRDGCAQQALAFFDIYRELRLQTVDEHGTEGTTARVHNRKEEVAFNEGRLYHGLGKLYSAVPCYERCLAVEQPAELPSLGRNGLSVTAEGSRKRKRDEEWVTLDLDGEVSIRGEVGEKDEASEKDDQEGASFKNEAALALQQVYTTLGDMKSARDVTERWLVF